MVTVYSAGPDCQLCRLTCECLEHAGIAFTLIDLSDDEREADRAFVKDELGYLSAPVVIVDGGSHLEWSGFRPDLIKSLILA
jgi:glutaredoxin-like protein NrdH